MKTRQVFILSFVLVAALLTAGISYAISPEEQAKICAQENLANYLGMIGDDYKNFHFSSREDLARAYLGEPIPNVRIGIKELDTNKALKDQAEPYPFYVFPVMVDNRVITDFTVVLDKGKWKPVDIGGNLSAIVEEVAEQNKLTPAASVILRFAGETFVIVNKDGQEFGYLPYFSDQQVKARKLIPSRDFRDILKKVAETKIAALSLPLKDTKNVLSMGTPEAPPLPFKQDSVGNRLIRYLRYLTQ